MARIVVWLFIAVVLIATVFVAVRVLHPARRFAPAGVALPVVEVRHG